MDQLPWTESGKQLLAVIEQYISNYGGRHGLLKAISDDERRYRHRLVCAENGGKRGSIRKRKRIKLIKGKTRRIFRDLDSAANYLGKTNVYLRNAICQPFKVNGWEIKYLNK